MNSSQFYQTIKQVTLMSLFVICNIAFAQTAPLRVLSLAPNITEMIFALNANDQLVGRTGYCLYPAQAQELPSIGGYLNPDYEKMITLQPNLVIMLPNADRAKKIQLLGLKTLEVPNETVADILGGLSFLGDALQKQMQAKQLIKGIEDTLQWIQKESAHKDSLTALLVIGREAITLKNLYAAGKATYLSEMLTLCGIKNTFANVDARYFGVSKEDLVKHNPDIIIEFRGMDAEKAKTDVPLLKADWQKHFPVLSAVKSGKIYILTENYFLIPGPRISKSAMGLFKAVRGEK